MKPDPENSTDIRLAVLIDADNISAQHIGALMQEIARYGNPTVKRIYGDWTKPNLLSWKQVLLDYAITPVQQFSYTSGKNSTDSAMIIDAMDLLYSERTDGFCLVSSDSDFTRLATRLREAGQTVYGIGEQKTPNAFIAACDKFVYIEILEEPGPVTAEEPLSKNGRGSRATTALASETETESAAKQGSDSKSGEKSSQSRRRGRSQKLTPEAARLIADTIRDCEDENGWAFLGAVGNLLLKKQPSFDSRNYGFDKLTPLIKSTGKYEIDVRDVPGSSSKHVFIRERRRGDH